MATKTATTRGFSLPCPMCGDPEVRLDVDLNDLNLMSCNACSEEFTPRAALEKAKALAAKWERVVWWLETAPTTDASD